MLGIRRREFITVLGSAAVAWPALARAQQGERMRRIGMLMHLAADDQYSKLFVATFLQELQVLGWTVGRNLQIDFRWTTSDADRIRKYAAELVALVPEIIVTVGSAHVGPLQQATRTIPIVFVGVSDAVGGGFVETMARPGGNTTGFSNYEYSISGKWLELLKAIAPGVKRVAILRNPENGAGTGQFGAIQGIASLWGIEVSPVGVRDAAEIERGVTAFARGSNGGLIVTPSGLAAVHRDLIITLAARHRLPGIYPTRSFVIGGGLMSYGPDFADQFRLAAGYVDRILKGEKPADMPVQTPTKFATVLNLKTARALGLTVPRSLLVRVDEVIE